VLKLSGNNLLFALEYGIFHLAIDEIPQRASKNLEESRRIPRVGLVLVLHS